MIAAEITRILEPNTPAKKRHASMAPISFASAVPSVKSVNTENDARKTGLRPYSSDNGA